jgi:voltage-gated potassium channel
MSATKSPGRVPWNRQTADGQVLLSMPWEVFVLGVALLSIVNLGLAVIVRNPDIEQVITIMDSILIVIFLIDLLRRLRVAGDRRAYMTKGWGWLDLVSIIPLLRIARLLRIVRVMRVVGRMGGAEVAMRAFFANKATGGLFLVVLIAILVMEFGSLGVLWAERGAEGANILTAEEAIWYLIVTMSTVGYGDYYPVTDVGRLLGSLIIVVGVGVFGTLTGFLANVFLAPSESAEEVAATEEVDASYAG